MGMNRLWQTLDRPFFVLAPMEDVTDTVFRRCIRRWSQAWGSHGPDVMFSEFTRVDGAVKAWENEVSLRGREDGGYGGPVRETPALRRGAALRRGEAARRDRLVYTAEERPVVAQLWGTRPDEFYSAARAVEELGFDGIDLNMGCPVQKIRKAGACSALIGNPSLAGEMVAACRSASTLPLGVKTRIGLDRVVTEEWIGFLLELNLDAITVHGRIADQLSEGSADWSEVGRAVALRNASGSTTAIIGNGDVRSLAEGYRRVEETGVDGVMIGRGVFSDPLLFARRHQGGGAAGRSRKPGPPLWHEIPLPRRLLYLREQIVAFTDHWGDRRNYEILKKFFRNYVCVSADSGGGEKVPCDTANRQLSQHQGAAAELLEELYETHDAGAALVILDRVIGFIG